jgi:hypothetical protein
MSGLLPGDIVRVRDPQQYTTELAKKLENRTGVVIWVGPTVHDMFKNEARVRFSKRNGRGKEFEMTIAKRELVKVEDLPK